LARSSIQKAQAAGDLAFGLYGDPHRSMTDQVLHTYEYPDEWVNRMIFGDSLVVMNSLLRYEGMGGQD
jgi:adenine-specific DNA-methyltransferase